MMPAGALPYRFHPEPEIERVGSLRNTVEAK